MKIKFSKYQGTGNDFILLDNRTGQYSNLSKAEINFLSNRKFGIGADGIMLLNLKKDYDFEMVYYNSDGNESTMCGNGGRCMVAFAKRIGIVTNKANFIATDGPHNAEIEGAQVALGMSDVSEIKTFETFYKLDTGSPHYVAFVDDVESIKVRQEGALIRNSPLFAKEGINVNFVQEAAEDKLIVRTYERGVEDETLSCGTGVTAASLVQMMRKNLNEIKIQTLGGHLRVKANHTNGNFKNIELIGPATFVFDGEINLNA